MIPSGPVRGLEFSLSSSFSRKSAVTWCSGRLSYYLPQRSGPDRNAQAWISNDRKRQYRWLDSARAAWPRLSQHTTLGCFVPHRRAGTDHCSLPPPGHPSSVPSSRKVGLGLGTFSAETHRNPAVVSCSTSALPRSYAPLSCMRNSIPFSHTRKVW